MEGSAAERLAGGASQARLKLEIVHETIYEYAEAAYDSHNEVRLRPRDDEYQRCLSFELTTYPSSNPRSRPDYFGNTVHYFSVAEAHRRLIIRAETVVECARPPGLDLPRDHAIPLAELERSAVRGQMVEYLTASPYVPLGEEIRRVASDLAWQAAGDGGRFWEAILGYFKENLTYETGATKVEDDALKVLEQRSGVCQDFAHLVIALARAAGVPARYVSGYVKPPGALGDASHAWADLYLPEVGWVGLDASGPGQIDERYVRVAYGRDYADANPIRGAFRGGGRQALSVDVRVQQMQEQ